MFNKVDVKYNLARHKEPRNLAFHLKPLNGPLTINKRSQSECVATGMGPLPPPLYV